MKLDANIRVAWYVAWGLQLSGSVSHRMSSQFCSVGMILNALGTFPVV